MVLAHGSGIDEILMFGIPVIVAVIALRVAEKRAQQRIDDEAGAGDHADPTGG